MRPSRQSNDNPVSFFSFQDVMMCTIGVTIVITMTLILQVGAAATAVELVAAESKADLGKSRAELATEAAGLKERLNRAAQSHAPNQAMARGALRQDLRSELEKRDRAAAVEKETEQKVREAVALSSADPSAIEAAELIRKRDELEERLASTQLRRRVTYLLAEDDRKPVIIEVSGSQLVAGTNSELDSPLALPLNDAQTASALLKQWIQSLPDASKRTLLFVVKPSGVAMWRDITRKFAEDPQLGALPRGLDLIEEDSYTSERFRPAATEAKP
ncbi:MAG: hypothetical protein K8R92_09720 [Planctomycetes bacterium]|nr:hypothetical protein [Planctomycetota bacterium]